MDAGLIRGISAAVILIFICVAFLFWDMRRRFREDDKAKILFTHLYEVCNNAKTTEQCNDAWNELMASCIENITFKIPISYKREFYELRSLLLGKLSILNN